jgi:FAD binding domain
VASERLRSSFRGELLLPSDAGYEDARRVWNAAADERPAMIARCSGVADVVHAVELAREHDLPIAVHGSGKCNGIVVDLARMRGVALDLVRRTVRVEAGAIWGDLDHETQAYGLATTGAMVSTVGVTSHVLGSGAGWLTRKHGLARDNLIAVDCVTPAGRILHASADDDADLFGELRAGGDIGIATSLEFRLHPIGPLVTAGAASFGVEQAHRILHFYREYAAAAPDELTTLLTLAGPVLTITGCHCGDRTAAPRAFQPLLALPDRVAGSVEPIPYAHFQRRFDLHWRPGARACHAAARLPALGDDAIAELAHANAKAESPMSAIFLQYLGGPLPYLLTVIARWLDPAADAVHTRWAHGIKHALTTAAAAA